jgi:glycerophosphoryl diester phosphodiesterase
LPFLWDTWELAPASSPRLGLAELLAADQRDCTFMLDLKGRSAATARLVAALLGEVSHERPLMVCGRHWPSVDALTELPFVRPVLSARNQVELRRLRRRLAGTGKTYGVSVHRSLLDEVVVQELHQNADIVMTWPVNDIRTLDAMLDVGVTGITSDEPDVLAELISRRP